MSKGQLRSAALVVNQSKGQLLRASLAAEAAKGRLLRAALTAPLSTTVSAGPDMQKEALALVSIGATYIGAVPTSWTWTQIAGPTVQLVQSGATVEFVAPATPDGTEVTLSVSATNAESQSQADFVTIRVYPNQWYDLVGSAWVPRRLPVTVS